MRDPHHQPDADPPAPQGAVTALFDDLDGFLRGALPLGRVLGLDPADLGPLTTTADRLLAAGRPRDAADLYGGCLYLFPEDPLTLCRLGTARALAGDAPGAQLCFDQALGLAGDDRNIRDYVAGITPAGLGAGG